MSKDDPIVTQTEGPVTVRYRWTADELLQIGK